MYKVLFSKQVKKFLQKNNECANRFLKILPIIEQNPLANELDINELLVVMRNIVYVLVNEDSYLKFKKIAL
jgi:hypothetical protein